MNGRKEQSSQVSDEIFQEEEIILRLTNDGELVDTSSTAGHSLEKRKKMPTLQRGLEQIYENPNERNSQLLENLQETANHFTELNEELRTAQRNYIGCKLAL